MTKDVLIVEDNDDLRALYEYALSGEGYAVKTAANGQIALDMLAIMPAMPGLIILDLMMPVMDGWEFLKNRAANETYAQVPVIVCTAVKEQTPTGVPFMRKPLDLNKLIETVQQHCKPQTPNAPPA